MSMLTNKKAIILSLFMGLFTLMSIAQPVSDRAIIPVAVTLNQILRLNVTDGGNIEFVFSEITDYENGIANGTQYNTSFNVASSTGWQVTVDADNATFIGTDNPANTMPLDNVGFQISEDGLHTVAGTQITDPAGAIAGVIALPAAATAVISEGALTNAGDILDNVFTLQWRAGTTEGAMNATSILDQDITPDRYVSNVLLDLVSTP